MATENDTESVEETAEDTELEVELEVGEAELDDAGINSDDDSDEDSDEDEEGEGGEALDELEAEELEMLTEDEAAETIVRDEAAEMAKLRREERELDADPKEVTSGERMCQSCFLIKRDSAFADSRKKICKDCEA